MFSALILSSATSIGLYAIGMLFYGAAGFWFLSWNLLLAWLPLLFMLLLVQHLKTQRWYSLQGIVITFLWLAFLPNSFYLVSDLVHMAFLTTNNLLFFLVLLFSFALNGLLLGYISVHIFHQELLKRFDRRIVAMIISAVFLVCSFAIYLGRYLRWSTWDIILHPAGVVFDISDRFVNPSAYGQTFQVTLWLFILLTTFYWVLRQIVKSIQEYK